MRNVSMVAVSFVLAVAFAGVCHAFRLAPPLKLDKLAEESDVIIKAKALKSETIEDEWFKKQRGFDAYATQMAVICVIKGDLGGREVVFQHYGRAKASRGRNFLLQLYEFQPGRAYLVFADKTDKPGVLRQLWKQRKGREDQGVMLAADKRPVAEGATVKVIIWSELRGLLQSDVPKDVAYAIFQLDRMSSSRRKWDCTEDFERDRALAQIHSFAANEDEQVATRAINAIGADSPYRDDWNAAHWLATVGGGKIPGLGKRDANVQNNGARKYWKDLAAVADGDGPATVRALAIRALGRAGEPAVLGAVARWIKDPEPLVRQGAVILLADFPGGRTPQLLRHCAGDGAAQARIGVARAIGFGQFAGLLPVLEQLLHDGDENVRTAAGLSLLSFSPAEAGEILKANADNPEFRSVFVNALADADPEPYLDALAETVEKHLEPVNFWGGSIPWGVSWKIMFTYLKGRETDELKSGRLDKYLDALEKPKFWSSSEPRDLYALHLDHGMKDRAARFREKCKKTLTYDIDYYFDQVDKR